MGQINIAIDKIVLLSRNILLNVVVGAFLTVKTKLLNLNENYKYLVAHTSNNYFRFNKNNNSKY